MTDDLLKAAGRGDRTALVALLEQRHTLPGEVLEYVLELAIAALEPKQKGRPARDPGATFAIRAAYRLKRRSGKSRDQALSEIADHEGLSVDQVGRIVGSKT